MFNFLCVIEIITIVSITEIVSFENYFIKQNYISLESGQVMEINEINNSESKETDDSEETSNIKNFREDTVADITTEDFKNETTTTTVPILENVRANPFNCEEKNASSSEEIQCKTTLVNYPFSASIQKKGAHYASGVLINKQSVLTAAGVFFHVRESIKLFRVRLGSVDCKKGGVLLPLKWMEIHPTYEYGKPAFDIALLRLASPVQLTDYVKPIPLSRIKQGVISAKFLSTYWPRLILNGNIIPKSAKERVKFNSMRVSTQKLIPWKTCAVMMKGRNSTLDETSLCLKPISTHHSDCMPDVGAPVIAEDGLWGVTSGWTSQRCSMYPSPTIITRTAVPPVWSWLESVL